jgi:hypothetical protein
MALQRGIHPRGTNAKVLLTSVFGPYAQEDEYGSQKINPMELWHNQVTRVQGPFSLRMFNRSFGMLFIQANIGAPCIQLDSSDPRAVHRGTQERSIRHHWYRQHHNQCPQSQKRWASWCEITRSDDCRRGHVANLPDLAQRIDADEIVKGRRSLVP